MRSTFYLALIVMLSCGCNMPTELDIPKDGEAAHRNAENFLGYVLKGMPDSAIAMLDTSVTNDAAIEFVTQLSHQVSQLKLKDIRVVEYRYNKVFWTTGDKVTDYSIAYEYEFDKGTFLFLTFSRFTGERHIITGFRSQPLEAPLAQLTAFTLSGKTWIHYVFFAGSILVPVTIIITLLALLYMRISVKKKIIWSVVILFVALPAFTIDWNTGAFYINLLNIRLLGVALTRPNLYSAWLLSINLPLGAIVFWINRKKIGMQQRPAIPSIETETE